MTQPFVSSYDQAFLDAFDKGIKEMPKDLSGLVKATLDRVHDDVLSSLQFYIQHDMQSNLDGEIRSHAAEVASSMLANALAGDDKEIRNLFGFNDWYMKHLYMGSTPTQWALIDAIVARRPDLFVDERIAQRDAEVRELNRQIANLKRRIEHLENPYAETET